MAKKKTTKKCDPSPAKLTPDPAADQLAKLAWAIAHPARVQIVQLLLRRDACVCGEIVSSLPLAQSTVSQHLKILKESGLIQGEVDGPKVCYCINEAQLTKLKTLVGKL
ncbi:ArsR/SmtB family transcription factor [Roseiconus lacunae]|uniref:Metalloregulator ArsR/SmtB family transcription factor n=1 Tax=Roseiconus lacunae TaxID=2605694 RepID=A0ABT7PRZ9_9BACT|nr:metalloregulator ArsR/SmtB family transcription factor [Roseiconus lacunae]MCD0457990.1 metalloregulator ArsR/SmtB family transcription factor [Roseiconus lacunae]MDM4019220.1 metalloregulator ArsR/SmtB family transcription factor [Roseiconus lacunae]WRQ48375.1 metalloregulator ArsR/SmtB family transcription factor [Stieleria sp. HD01]